MCSSRLHGEFLQPAYSFLFLPNSLLLMYQKVSFVEKALSVAAAVLGLSTMYIMLVNLFLRLTDENPSENFTISYFKLILFRWVVLATFVLALFLHGLETTPLGISWREEQTARNHRGQF